MTSADDRSTVVEGLAAYAITLSSMGTSEVAARSELCALLQRVRAPDVHVVRDAAAAVGRFPVPLDEPAAVVERGEPIRRMLDLPEPSEELAAQLRAREWLQRLAADLDR